MKGRNLHHLSLLLTSVVATAPSVLAAPHGEAVVAGNATFDRSTAGALIVNQFSPRAIIQWQDFSIPAGEVVRFVQPSSTAAVLNRVMGASGSEIYGSLQANGQVYLLNPNGVLIGPGGSIDTGTFIASTLDVANESFLAGTELTFSGDSRAAIQNGGRIQTPGGDVFLFARTVNNTGSINANNGTVGLAAGTEVLLKSAGPERVAVRPATANGAPLGTGVNNMGAVNAAVAELKAAGGNLYALAINNGGIVRATSIALKSGGGDINNSGVLTAKHSDGSGGSVTLDGGRNPDSPSTVINSGTIDARGDAPGTHGGEVKVLGDRVRLADNSVVDVSGDGGGGTALIGGGYKGQNPDVQNAQRTIVDKDAVVHADALRKGDGGSVVIWSEDGTHFAGTITARGGKQGGDGGSAEVSSRNHLGFEGAVDLRADRGEVGELLLDPATVIIGSVNADDEKWVGNLPLSEPTKISSSLVSQLLGLATVTIQAASEIQLEFGHPIDASRNPQAHDLILKAPEISLSADIKTRGKQTYLGNVFVEAPVVLTGTEPMFEYTVTGRQSAGKDADLTLNFSGTTVIDGGKFTDLHSITTGNGGLTMLQGSIVTVQSQVYGDRVEVVGNVVLTTATAIPMSGPSGAITFRSTVDGKSGSDSLTLKTGYVRFFGDVGRKSGLANLQSSCVTFVYANIFVPKDGLAFCPDYKDLGFLLPPPPHLFEPFLQIGLKADFLPPDDPFLDDTGGFVVNDNLFLPINFTDVAEVMATALATANLPALSTFEPKVSIEGKLEIDRFLQIYGEGTIGEFGLDLWQKALSEGTAGVPTTLERKLKFIGSRN